MKFSVDAKVLAGALAFVGRAISPRPSHPVLACVVIRTISSGLSLSGFDLSTGLIKYIDSETIAEGSVAVPFKLFNDIVSKLSGGVVASVILEEETGSTRMTLVAESGQYTLSCMDVSYYPEMPECTGDSFSIPTATLSDGLDHVIPFASTDDTKQVLTGVHIVCKDSEIEFASTDGHRLAVFSAKLEEPLEGFALTIPSKSLTAIAKMGGDSINIAIGESIVKFHCDDSIMICRVLDGKYPAYKQLIPTQYAGEVFINPRQMLSALDRLGLFTDGKNNIVTLDIGTDKIIGQVEVSEMGQGVESIPCEPQRLYPLTIGFNIKYLQDGLKAISGKCRAAYNQPDRPVVFKNEEGNFLYLAMPVHARQ